MRVYVESNFPLELARQQEEIAEAEQILKLAETGRIELAFPAIALTEPFSALLRYANERARVLQTLNQQLTDLARSQPHQMLVTNMAAVVTALATVQTDETDLLELSVERMLKAGRSIPLTATTFMAARKAEVDHALSPQDAIVFASVIADLDAAAAPLAESCFISRNSKDFGVTRGEFARRNCAYKPRFSAGLRYVLSKI